MDVDADKGLGGREFTRELSFGGGGKLPMLVVLRTVLPGVPSAEDKGEGEAGLAFDMPEVLRVGTAGVD